MQFVDVKSDIAFKKIFGNENKKEILISFLNAVLNFEGDREIESIEILNPYQAPHIDILKETILDVRAKNKKGVTFIVEMQVEKKTGFEKRVVYYTSKAFVNQIDKGDDYPKLNQVIFIGILNFNVFGGERYLTHHLILNSETLNQDLSDLAFNFIELPKFDKKEEELDSMVDKWIYFIKNVSNLKVIPANADTIELKEAYEVANKFSWDKEELEIYDYWLMREQDARGAIETAKIEGKQEGIQEGRLTEKVDIAKKLLDILDDRTIAQKTGLTDEEVSDLRGDTSEIRRISMRLEKKRKL